jgi:hypothetical protein
MDSLPAIFIYVGKDKNKYHTFSFPPIRVPSVRPSVTHLPASPASCHFFLIVSVERDE